MSLTISGGTLPDGVLAYLATPYTLYRKGHEFAFREACRIAGDLVTAGVEIFSPIAHFHAITAHSIGLDPLDGEFWLKRLGPFMARSDVLIVAEMDGWKESAGINHELGVFARARKPIFALDPARMLMRRTLAPGSLVYAER